jgi:thiol-disulfide isomerase/thioredoxin
MLHLPVESRLPSFDGGGPWLNSEPLTADGLRGRVVVVNFWTYTCINWLRSLPYVRAWAQRYGDAGLVTIGVHSPEFPFEHDLDNVRRAVKDMRVDHPVVIDNDFAIWRAFGNHYWPALYLADAQGRIRHHSFGEGDYDRSEAVIRQLLADAGSDRIGAGPAVVQAEGAEVGADWAQLQSAETYLGAERTDGFASPGGAVVGRRHRYAAPARLGRNEWALAGEWRVGEGGVVLDGDGGSILYRFHARDLHLVMGPLPATGRVSFRVRLDGQPPGDAHGTDVDADGNGVLAGQRLYQLIRQPTPIVDRRFEIEFLGTGVEALVFTFG